MVPRSCGPVLLAAVLATAGCRLERNPPRDTNVGNAAPEASTLLGLRTVVYHVRDLNAAKAWYAELLGIEPYFDEPFYVGFSVGGYELGLDPDTTGAPPGPGGTVAYWGVTDADSAVARAITLGAKPHQPVQDVGGGVSIGSVLDPFGNILGLVENPSFEAVVR